jgi:TRAP-type C4-dicarboxylate transport system substrate-binding protein
MQNLSQKYLTLWNYMNDPLIFVVNKDVWKSWTPEDQKIVRQAAIDAGQQETILSRKPLEQTIAALGVEITTLTPAQTAAFAQATKGVYEKWTKMIGPDLVKLAEKEIASAK